MRRIIREGDLGEIARLSDEFWYHLPDRYGPELLERVARTPAAELERRPRVLYASRLAAEFSEDSRDPTLRRVIDFHRSVGARYASRFEIFTDPGDVLIAGTTASIGARLEGDLDEAERIAARVQARLDELEVTEATSWHATIAGGRPGWLPHQRSLTLMLAGDYDGAIRHATAAFVQSGPAPHHNWSASGAAAHLALLAAIRGHRTLAEEWLDRLFEKGPVHPRVEHLTTLGAKLARAHLAMDRLDADAAAGELEAAGSATEPVELWPFVAHAEARYGKLFGDPHAALVRLDAARFAHGIDDRHWARGGYVLARARADLLAELGDVARVTAIVQQHREIATLLVALARAHLLAGRWSAAAEVAERGLRGASVRDAVDLRVIMAAALLHLHDRDAAREHFAIALATRAGDDHRAPFASVDVADATELFRQAGLTGPFIGDPPARAVRRVTHDAAAEAPYLTDAVARPRLLRVLDEGGRLVVLRAGAGAGKTAVASEWVAERRRRGRQTVWLQVDAVTAPRVGFWRRAVAVLEEHGRLRADGDLAGFVAGDVPVEAVPGLVVELLYQYNGAVRVVVDDIHLLAPEAVRDIIWVLERAPQLILVATSRGGTLVDDPNVSARFGGSVIDAGELALTLRELRELAGREGLTLDGRELEVLSMLTRGNPLTARLAVAAVARAESVRPIDAGRLADTLAAAVSSEVLAEFPHADERGAAVRLAVAPAVDLELAAELAELTDVAAARHLLRSFRDRGLGELDESDGNTRFGFHVLVRHVLRREGERRLGAAERELLLRRAATHAEERGDPVTAMGLLVEAQAYDVVWAVFVRNFSELATNRVDDMIAVLGRIPAADLTEHGTLGIALAIMLSERESTPSGRVRRLVATGLRALHRLPPPRDETERHERLLAEFGALRAARQYERAAGVGEAIAAQQRAMGGADEQVREMFAVGMMQVVVTDVLAGAFPAAVSHAAELAHDDHPGRSSHRRSVLAEAHAIEGDVDRATPLARSLSEEATEEWASSLYAKGWYVARALLAIEAGDPRAALSALEPVERTEFTEHWAYGLWVSGLAHLLAGTPQQGLDAFELSFRSQRGRGMSRYAADLLTAVRADLALAAGDVARADAVLSGRGASAPLALARARAALAHDNSGHALRALEEVDWSTATRRHLGESLLLAAVVHLREDNRSSAEFALARAVGILGRSHLTSPFALVPRRALEQLGAELPGALAGLADPFAALGGRVALSPREQAVLAQLVTAGSVVGIAEALFVSQNTVKTQLRSIYRKLGVSSRDEAVQEARRQGLLGEH